MPNDSKYGRLYPERAIAPLRETAKMLVEDGLVTDAGAVAISDALEQLDSLGFPPDEPLFLLRGQDELASECVDAYALAVFNGRGYVETAEETAKHLMAHADRMRAWQPRKLPD